MKLEEYEKISSFLLIEEDDDVDQLYKKYSDSSIDYKNFQGIYHRYSQELYRKRISIFLKNTNSKTPLEWFKSFLSKVHQKEGEISNGTIIKMSKELYNIPSCYLARLITRGYVESLIPKRKILNDIDDLEDEFVNLLMEKPLSEEGNVPLLSFSKLYKTPSLIPLIILRENVLMCHQEDRHCSPKMDQYRTDVGLEYENILENFLKENEIPFMNEGEMRKMGYAKTPDSILLQPIAIERENGDPLIIKWIESKAWFGDPSSHQTYLRDQYWPYYNRFGPGLVIYWMGMVDEMIISHQDNGVAVMDHFPLSESIIRIESSLKK